MKVLQINTVYGYGSTGRIVADLTKEINGQGYDAFVAYGQRDSSYSNSFKIGTVIENHIHNLLSRLLDKQGLFSTRGTRKLIKYIVKIKPDVIHLHNLHGNFVNINILFNYLSTAKIPIVWTMHDCWAFTGHCAYFDYVNCNKWTSECKKCPAIKSYPPSLFADNSKSNFNNKKNIFNLVEDMTIVTPSKWLARLTKKSFLSKFEVNVINNGIDTNVFRLKNVDTLKSKLGLENQIVLLGVSAEGFTGRKGLKYFVELANLLDKNYKIILIGVSDSEIKELPENILGIKRTNNIDQLAEYYSLADIFLNPTLEDNFPTTNLEALACGTPVITFNTGGSPEVIDEETGAVVDKMDTTGLYNTVLAMNSQFKKKNSYNCRKKAVENYGKNLMYQQYVKLYQEQTK